MAPFHGSRPGEHCKLKPGEIVEEEGEWVMRFRRDKRAKAANAASANNPRRQKTRQSVRDVPLHWIVLEGGFLDLVAHQRGRGAEWLFDDLRVDGYGDRYRLLSNEINRALRKLGISDVDKAFYSTRHTMKREGRRRHIAKQSLDQLAGHASGDAGDRYGQGLPIEILKEDIDRLEFRSGTGTRSSPAPQSVHRATREAAAGRWPWVGSHSRCRNTYATNDLSAR